MRKAFLATVLCGLLSVAHVRGAHALNFVHFAGGPMKNLTVDLIFWGNNFTNAERQTVMQTVLDVANWTNGASTNVNQPPPGMEAAIHYYGLASISLGLWVNDSSNIGAAFKPPGTSGLDDGNFQPVVARARSGGAGDSAAFSYFDFSGTTASATLPSGTNRLALVITKGTNNYCISLFQTFGGCASNVGYHYQASGNPHGAVMFESINSTLSHEILETMTDPYPPNGWVANTGAPGSWDESADECGDTNEFASLTVNAPYTMGGVSTTGSSCMRNIPARHAPLAASFGQAGPGGLPLFVYFVDRNGHVKQESWSAAGAAAQGPFDLGQPSPTVRATGKPTAVFQNMSTFVFVKGSDNGLWMLSGTTWTNLGGIIYGDPSAVSWVFQGTLWIHVAVLGTDSHIWLNGIRNGTPMGWAQVDGGPTLFAGAPNLVSQAAESLDVFATGEDGYLKWLKFRSSWSAPVTVSTSNSIPITSKPAITRINGTTNGLAMLATSAVTSNQTGLYQTTHNGSSWSSFVSGQFNITSSEFNYGFHGTPALLSTAANRVDAFAVSRSGKLWWFWNGNLPGNSQWHTMNTIGAFVPPALVTSGASGDPVALSRGAGKMEVFFRTDDGRLKHMTTTNSGSNWTTETVLPVNTIQ